jgi:hypothetical protein
MPTYSKKHHYIPKFYLKGFTDAANQFYIYDKETEKIWLSSPENSFIENHRNTGIVINSETKEVGRDDLPEEMLSHFDDRFATTIYNIRKSTPSDDVLTPDNLYNLRLFIISTFWRTPANDKIRNAVIHGSSFKDLGFGIFNKDGRQEDTEKMMMNIDLWIKMYPVLLSMVSFRKEYNSAQHNDFKLYYRSSDVHVVTDNPILLKSYENFSSLNNDFFFPVSSKIFMIASKGNKPKTLPAEFNMKVDLLLFKRAHRYVACHDKSYLTTLLNMVKSFERFGDFGPTMMSDLLQNFYLHID